MQKDPLKEQAEQALLPLDEKDKAILRYLQGNAKATVREIAASIHLSTTPVHERIKRMEEEGVILQYATIINHARINKGITAICYISLKEHNRKSGGKFIKTIQEMPEVTEFHIISGAFDFMLKVVTGTMDDYYHFHVNKLGQLENIAQVQSTFVMGTIKNGQPQIT
jgi:DNA-binding Lrp family transcriptional regulator